MLPLSTYSSFVVQYSQSPDGHAIHSSAPHDKLSKPQLVASKIVIPLVKSQKFIGVSPSAAVPVEFAAEDMV